MNVELLYSYLATSPGVTLVLGRQQEKEQPWQNLKATLPLHQFRFVQCGAVGPSC